MEFVFENTRETRTGRIMFVAVSDGIGGRISLPSEAFKELGSPAAIKVVVTKTAKPKAPPVVEKRRGRRAATPAPAVEPKVTEEADAKAPAKPAPKATPPKPKATKPAPKASPKPKAAASKPEPVTTTPEALVEKLGELVGAAS